MLHVAKITEKSENFSMGKQVKWNFMFLKLSLSFILLKSSTYNFFLLQWQKEKFYWNNQKCKHSPIKKKYKIEFESTGGRNILGQTDK